MQDDRAIERNMRIIKHKSNRVDVCFKFREYVGRSRAGLDARSACSQQSSQQ